MYFSLQQYVDITKPKDNTCVRSSRPYLEIDNSQIFF